MSGGDIGAFFQQMNNSGALQGLANMGATMADAGAPGLGYRGLGAGLARGAAAFGPGMLQGAEQQYEQQQLMQARAQAQQFQGAFGGAQDGQLSPSAMALRNMVPAQMRPIMYALGPQEGAKMLATLALTQLDPTRGRIKLAPGETVFNEISGKPDYQNPFSPKENMLDTQAGTMMMGPDGMPHLVAPKPPEVNAVGPYAYQRNFQTGQTTAMAPPGSDGGDGSGGLSMKDVILAAEGNGKNPLSSAAGYGGFTSPTAKEFMQKYGAEAAQALGNPAIAQAAQGDDQGLGFFRMNPDVQKFMTGKMVAETSGLVNQALPDTQKTPADYYAGYVLRNDAPGFLQAVRQNPGAPVNKVLPAAVISANPWAFTNSDGSMATVGQAYQQFGSRAARAVNVASAKQNPMRFTPSDLVPAQNPDGSKIYVPKENAAGLEAPASQQTNVSVQGGATPSASVSIGAGTPGGAGTGGIPLGAAGAPPKEEIANSTKQLDFLNQVSRDFKPSYLSTLGNLKMWTLAAADRATGGQMLPADQKKELADFTSFKQKNQTLVIERLHQLFGARLTPPEMARATPTMPSMEDSPTEWLSKFNTVHDMAENAIMRDVWLQKNGLALTDKTRGEINVTDMPSFINSQVLRQNEALAAQNVPVNIRAQRLIQWTGENFGMVPRDIQAKLQPLAGAQ